MPTYLDDEQTPARDDEWWKIPAQTTWFPDIRNTPIGQSIGAQQTWFPDLGSTPIGTVLQGEAPRPLGWDKPPETSGGPSSAGGAGSLGDYAGIYTAPLTRPYDQTFQAPNPVNLGGPPGIEFVPPTPQFNGPSYQKPPAFEAPTYDDVANDPGYQFASKEGVKGLEQGAAARGALNTGNTLKDVVKWAGDYAAQRYNDVFNRKLTTYGTNYLTQYTDPYRFAYQSALDSFAPQMQGYQTQAAAGQRATETNYANAYQRFMDDYRRFSDWQDRVFNKTFALSNA